MAGRSDLWGGADPYERYMGRWSRRVAPTFLDWLGMPPGRDWVDVGCGTGALSSAIIDRSEPASVVGIDRTAQFLDVARARIQDERFETIVADADALPNHDGAFGAAVSGLVLNFVADKDRAVAEMVRVTRPGGSVGLYVWDYAGHMQVMRHFFDVAAQLDPAASRFDDGLNAPVCRPGPLIRLFEDAGLADVEVTTLDFAAAFTDFDDYWSPFLGGTGSAPKYVSTLSPTAQEELREALRRRLPAGPDGEILLAVRAWGVRGVVPGDRASMSSMQPTPGSHGGGPDLRLAELSLSANDVPAMVRFYEAVFEAGLVPFAAYGTTFYRGSLHGVRFVIAPNDLAGVVANQNRHQFVYLTSDVAALLTRVVDAGGTVRDSTGTATTVLDPDGNTLVLQAG